MSDGATLVAISGIDASGKGYVTSILEAKLRSQFRTVVLHVDDWLRPASERFDANRPGEHFYESAIRFDELFAHVRALRASEVDVILLEGIFLLKREYRDVFDTTVWVDCSFETALQRAVRRNQEGLASPDDIIRDYQQIYFPAQRIHFERDDPRAAASIVIENDDEIVARAMVCG